MNNELTRADIAEMEEEIEHRTVEVRKKLLEEVKRTRAFGDLSENFEYHEAKKAKNENESRIRYLEGMIKTARVIEDHAGSDEVGLFDKVELYLPEDDETETVQVVTTVRCDPRRGLISKESPMGRQLLGKKAGDRFIVRVDDKISYPAEIRKITKTDDDGSAPLLSY